MYTSREKRWLTLVTERIRSLTERGSRATSGAQYVDDQVDQALCLTLVTKPRSFGPDQI